MQKAMNIDVRVNLQVEAFLMNPTFSSKGGFRIIINGVTIYQVIYHPIRNKDK